MDCEPHLAISRATRKKDRVIHKKDTLEEQRPHFSHKNIVCTTQVSPSRRRPEQNRPRRRSYYWRMLCRSLACGMYTPPQHITTDLRRRASLNSDRDIESIQPSLTRCHRAPHHICVLLKQSTLVPQRTISAQCSSCRSISWRNVVFDNRILFTLSSHGVPH